MVLLSSSEAASIHALSFNAKSIGNGKVADRTKFFLSACAILWQQLEEPADSAMQ